MFLFHIQVFEDLFTYMKSLEKLVSLKPQKLYPGHGPVIEDAVPKVQMYIDHRNMRERQIMEVLSENTHRWMTPMEMVKIIYVVSTYCDATHRMGELCRSLCLILSL